MSAVDVAVFVLIIAFAGITGVNGGGNLIGTYLTSNSLRPAWAVALLSLSVLAGPFLFGTQVSHTIAVQIVNFQRAGSMVLATALAGSLITLGITWYWSVPTTATLVLAGSLAGATLVGGHPAWVEWGGVATVSLGLVGSVIVGFGAAYVITRLLWFVMARVPRIGFVGGRAQWVTIIMQGLVYGANDQEKAIGLMALLFMLASRHHQYHVTLFAIFIPWVAWLVGLFAGGLRIAKTTSGEVFRMRDMAAASAQFGAALTVGAAALAGFPVSTTQTVDGSLFGTGTAINPYGVRWSTLSKFLWVWALTLPISAVMGGLVMLVVRVVGRF